MSGWHIPEETLVSANLIPTYRQTRQNTEFAGCTQVNSIFLKADGKLSCSCMRYRHILGDANEVNVADFFNSAIMGYIRESFRDGYEPFDFCEGCPSRQTTCGKPQQTIMEIIGLHIEPSSQCNLFCEACTCTYERLSNNPPPRRNLEFTLYEKVVRDIHAAGLKVDYVGFVGFGEPLFNSRMHDMARLARRLFPYTEKIFLDTNANFGERRAEELADCGLEEIRLGIDGMDQDSYSAYRKSGNFNRSITFARKLAGAIRAKNSPTRVTWKYILFRHNDRDDQIIAAMAMADEIGIPIIFDTTVGHLASVRSLEEISRVIGERKVGCNIDRIAFTDPTMPPPTVPLG